MWQRILNHYPTDKPRKDVGQKGCEMEYRQLGSAGVRVSAIGLGTNRFGSEAVPQNEVSNIIAAAQDLGSTLSIPPIPTPKRARNKRWAMRLKGGGTNSSWPPSLSLL
jgi:hypothetical protein